MRLAIFDIDNTLIAGDSDLLWGEFLCERNYVDSNVYKAEHEKYYKDYLSGKLDINNFLKFQLKVLGENDLNLLKKWRKDFFEEKIRPVILPKAYQLIDKHRNQNHDLLIITATNRFIVEPIASEFKIENIIACEPEIYNEQFTGKFTGTPSYAEGKVERFNDWLKTIGRRLEESWFYSDSHNDIPLMKEVNHPVAVDPDESLKNEAIKIGWPIISLR
jgi:HAD superfamily hydrolase (TIGR01490 family)|tara:strand:- start:287 stop:940 length:654 start_codon:yes stop_codon:yes gene_type:complete